MEKDFTECRRLSLMLVAGILLLQDEARQRNQVPSCIQVSKEIECTILKLLNSCHGQPAISLVKHGQRRRMLGLTVKRHIWDENEQKELVGTLVD